MFGGNGPTYASTLQLSDEQTKTGVPEEHTRAMADFLDTMHAHQYRYKNPDQAGAGRGTYVSPMAQELAATPLGSQFVSRGSDGNLRVDYGKMAGTQLAATAYMNERVNRLERRVGR
jgi:hypothetical protein